KHGHTPMSEEDLQRLIEVARDPPQALRLVLQPEDLVDAVTGATQPTYAKHVVPLGALTTHRVMGLVRDTARVLQGAPVAWDQKRLQQVMQAAGEDHRLRAQALAELLPTLETRSVALEAHHFMARSYLLALQEG